MLRQIIWYPDGSPTAAIARGLPDGFEAHPLSAVDSVRRRADDPEAVVVDLDHDPVDVIEALGGKLAGVPVLGLVTPSEEPERWPKACYAYLPKPVTPFILARTLENALEHGRLAR